MKDVNVSKIINIVQYCFYCVIAEIGFLAKWQQKIVCDCPAGIVIAGEQLSFAMLCDGSLYTTRKCES